MLLLSAVASVSNSQNGTCTPLNLVDVVLIPENLRQKPLARQMLLKPRLCRFLIRLERCHKVGSERSRKLPHHNDGISAERA